MGASHCLGASYVLEGACEMSGLDDPFAKMVADLDQVVAGMPMVARLLRAYFGALVAQGFTESEALALTLNYQSATLRAAYRG